MTTVTFEVPDELAGRLALAREQLPKMLAFALDMQDTTAGKIAELDHNSPLVTEIVDFLASRPTYADIITFKASLASQARLEELLERNREEGLNVYEQAELDTFQQANHLLILLKSRVRATVSSSNLIHA